MGSNYALDSDVMLNFILNRSSIQSIRQTYFDLAYNDRLLVFFSVLNVSNNHYFLRKQHGIEDTIQKIRELVSF